MSDVKRWHVPPAIGRIQSGVPTIEVVAAADYDALARECDLLNYDVNDAVKKNVDHLLRIHDLEMALGLAAEKENSARGWELFQTFRKKYAELRFPGMTGEVHTCSPLSDATQDREGEHGT